MASSSGKGLCGAIIFFVVGLALILSGVKKYLLYQKITNTPTSKVRSAAVGLVELFGNAKRYDKLVSPISKKACAYWMLKAQWYKSGKHGGWREFYKASSPDLFYLKDETGQILVNPTEAQVEIPHDLIFRGYISGKGIWGMAHNKMDQKVLDFIDGSDMMVKNKFLAKKNVNVRIFEYFIAENDPVYVLGTAQPVEGKGSTKGHENLIIMKGKHDNMFYISDTQEKKISDTLRTHALLHTLGGLALSALMLFLILISYFNV